MKSHKSNRNYKDSLFRIVFSEKKELLSLYNAINGSDYDNPDELQVTTLKDVIYIGIKNDLSFIIGSVMNLYEHQSTYNPNMPLRGFLYFAELYQEYIDENELDILQRKAVQLPVPQYVIFYNGCRNEKDKMILKLSDLFVCPPDKSPCLECEAVQLNINIGHNRELMDKCIKLQHYSKYISEVLKNVENGMSLTEAIDKATDECIRNNILADILRKNRSEVRSVILTEYNEELHIRTEKQNSLEEGIELGIERGRREGIELGRREGVEQGRRNAMLEGAKKMLETGKLALEEIPVFFPELSEDDINSLK